MDSIVRRPMTPCEEPASLASALGRRFVCMTISFVYGSSLYIRCSAVHIYVLRNNLVRIDDNICTMDESYTYSLHPVTYLIPKCGTYCYYHSVTIFTIRTRP